MSEFRAFLLKTNALALAIGVIIGAALGVVVTSLVNDIIMPPIGLALGGVDFDTLQYVLKEGATPEETVAIRYGSFIQAIITFIIVALVVFWISKRFLPNEADEAPTRLCPFCREINSMEATRCKACTSEMPPETTAA
ncbi:MAG TPA: large conductance mechanosensitive channel protein MscL [Candidatus Limnocylindrales bacterium]|nr:large conductance mechanosensitive channel protein MscL [Candidatus Limnocylindrales bacterium]